MMPVLVIEHTHGEGPGHFGAWLAERGRPMTLVRVHAGDTVPVDLDGYAGVCVLGGPMSANDEHLDHIRAELALMRLAVDRGLPVIGHCLGGQLLARVLGASVGPSPAPEIGWHQVNATETAAAQRWFGDARSPVVMQWHYEAFSLPQGATRLAGNDACPHQAFEWGGLHLGMQFHPEADQPTLDGWVVNDRLEAEALSGLPTAQSPAQIAEGCRPHLGPMRRLAFRIYDTWAGGLAG
jgi:GMP synthase (glutamine-hydrolysing)